ncbi:MAG: NUDIX domain-containing protein [Stappiaceae bacterium]
MRASDRVEPLETSLLADDWGTLTKYRYRMKTRAGDWREVTREAYDRGHGATCLLYDPDEKTILLTRQFRLPVYLADEPGFLIETPAGLLEGAEARTRMHLELEEETGFQVRDLIPLFDLFMSPGSVTEYLAFFTGHYSQSDRKSAGGGNNTECEDIEVIHMPLDEALTRVGQGEMRDAKTVLAIFHLARTVGV